MEPTLVDKSLVKSLSVTTFEAVSSSKIPKRKESMHRRLSIQRSVEDLLKNIKSEELYQKMSTDHSSVTKTPRTTSGMQSLVNLSESTLKEKYASDPFFQAHIKHLTRELVSTKNIKKVSRKSSFQYQSNHKMISFLEHAQLLKAKHSQMMEKFKEGISKDEGRA